MNQVLAVLAPAPAAVLDVTAVTTDAAAAAEEIAVAVASDGASDGVADGAGN